MAQKTKQITAIILARGGSKRLPRKNVKKLLGKPLIAYSIEAAKKANAVSRVIIFTDDKEIATVSKKYGAEVINQPAHLAQDQSKATDALAYLLDLLKKENQTPEAIVFLQPTSPLRTTADIDGAVKLFLTKKCESVVTMFEAEHHIHWAMALRNGFLAPLIDQKSFKTRSQDLPAIYIPNGAMYVATPSSFLKNRSFYTKKSLPYVMPRERSIDIDAKEDFIAAENYLKHAK